MTIFFLVLPPQIQSLLQTFEEPWTGGKARFYWKTLESSPLGFRVLVWDLRSWLYRLWEAHLKRLLCPPDQNVPAPGPRFQLPNLSLPRCCCRLRVHGLELPCSLRDTGLVLFVAGHSCIHTAIVWRNTLLLMQTSHSECGNSVLEAWHILELFSFILPRQLPVFPVCPSLVTV